MIKDRIFRGKTVGSVNVWVTGYYLYSEKQDKHYILGDAADYGFQLKEVFGDSVGQSTGIYNEHGQLLWEGDVVRNPPGYNGDYTVSETVSCVSFSEAEFYAYNQAETLWWLYCEVIGNRFDNEELVVNMKNIHSDAYYISTEIENEPKVISCEYCKIKKTSKYKNGITLIRYVCNDCKDKGYK